MAAVDPLWPGLFGLSDLGPVLVVQLALTKITACSSFAHAVSWSAVIGARAFTLFTSLPAYSSTLRCSDVRTPAISRTHLVSIIMLSRHLLMVLRETLPHLACSVLFIGRLVWLATGNLARATLPCRRPRSQVLTSRNGRRTEAIGQAQVQCSRR